MIGEIVKKYRASQQMTLRDFAEALSIDSQTVSYETIRNWEEGKYQPRYHFFIALMMCTKDWRRDFAIDCLSFIKPDIYKPITEIGRSAIQGE